MTVIPVFIFSALYGNFKVFFSEYVGGGTLRKLIKTKEIDIPWSQRFKIALDVSEGMSYLHSKEASS